MSGLRASGHPNLFRHPSESWDDGERLTFTAEFDAAFSNAALHWMLDGAAVAAGIFRALKPGARFVGEMGGAGNIATLRTALRDELDARGYPVPPRDPQWYPTADEFARLYAAAGFVDIDARLIPRPTPLPPASPAGSAPSAPASWIPPKCPTPISQPSRRRSRIACGPPSASPTAAGSPIMSASASR